MLLPQVGSQNNMEHFSNDNHWPQYLYNWRPVNGVTRNSAHTINQLLLRRTPPDNNLTQNQALQKRQDSGSVINLPSFSEVRSYIPRVTTLIAFMSFCNRYIRHIYLIITL